MNDRFENNSPPPRGGVRGGEQRGRRLPTTPNPSFAKEGSCFSWFLVPVSRQARATAPRRLVMQNSRNEPGISMKTKDNDKKSRSRGVEKLRSSGTRCATAACQHPATQQLAPQLLNSSTPQLFRGNKPRMSMKTKGDDKKSRSREVEELRGSGSACETEACRRPAARRLAPQLLNSSTSRLLGL